MESAALTFIKHVFGPTTEQPVHVCSLGNERDGRHAPRFLSTRDLGEVTKFVTKWDQPERGLFFCVSTLPAGKKREKANIAEIALLHADIDFKHIDDKPADVERKLANLRMPPSITVRSGNGLHAYWLLNEALEPSERERVEAALSLLADLVAGDRAVCEVARLMRLPGTHNTKQGAWSEVEIATLTDVRYELDDLEEWLAETSPVILRADRDRAVAETNPFLQVAQRLGYKPPIDVEKRLSAMMYMGGGDAAIHQTQLAVTASLLNSGVPVDEVVATVLDATRCAAGEYGSRWNWRREERAIYKMCETWQRKHPAEKQAARTLANLRQREEEVNGTPAQVVNGSVVDLAEARSQRKKTKRKDSTNSVAAVVADGVVESVRAAGQDILLSEGEIWLYADGVWHIMTPADQQWLLTLIQQGFEALGEPVKSANLNASWKRLTEHPLLFKRTVPWAGGSLIVCQNGVLTPATGQWSDHSPARYARRKIGAAYDPAATCPKFAKLVTSMFEDRADGREYANLIQEWAGAALAIAQLNREERKALILVGPSRTGKTELSRILRLLIGDPVATPSIAEMSERFGLASLYGAAAWIRDDAINEGDDLDPQRFKTIVTGEPIDIERKHRPAVCGVELALPVLLTTNSLPRARDRSDAIFNRSLILEMTNVVEEASAHELRLQAGAPRGLSIGSHIWKLEGSGILNWALEGLARLVQRGSFNPPENVRNAIQRFKDDNNPVGEWARSALSKSPHSKVARADLMCAYHGWQREQDGDEARALGARAFFPRLRALTPWAGDMTDATGRRFVTGVSLTDEGVQMWDLHNQGPQLKSGSKGLSLTKHDVNRSFAPVTTTVETTNLEDANAPRF